MCILCFNGVFNQSFQPGCEDSSSTFHRMSKLYLFINAVVLSFDVRVASLMFESTSMVFHLPQSVFHSRPTSKELIAKFSGL